MQLLAHEETLPAFCRKRVLILGCGNVLFGDDGFGPAVMCWLDDHWREDVPADVCLMDAGTGVRSLLFTLTLGAPRPRRLIIVDAVDVGRQPGEVFTLPIDELPVRKTDDFSLHQLPTSNLLKELQAHRGIDVRILACQAGRIPDVVSPGLSDEVRNAVPRIGAMILEMVGHHE